MSKNNADLIRKHLLELRKNLSVAQCQRGSLLIRARLFTWLGIASEQAQQKGINRPLVVAAFWSLPSEPELQPLLYQWDEAGIVLTLPVMDQTARNLTFHRWTSETEMVPAGFGVYEPIIQKASTEAPPVALTPDVILVPALGYSRVADRLGYGKGFYDKTLHGLRRQGHDPVTIGISWDEGAIEAEFPNYTPEPHDQALDTILTPSGWVPGPINFLDH
jgi:5-formyltetrahydrofolate cyclo-ligase